MTSNDKEYLCTMLGDPGEYALLKFTDLNQL